MHLFSPKSRLATASGPPVPTAPDAAELISRSSSGGGAQGGGSGLSSRSGSGGSSGAGGGSSPPEVPRSNRSGQPQGQEQSAGFQPDERYWSDYLRIALPVVGLLLMLGLFWYWANSIIGDNGKPSKPAAPVVGLIVSATAPVPTGTAPPAITVPAGSTVPAAQTTVAVATTGDANPTPTTGPDKTPAGRVSKFRNGDLVVIANTDSANLRDSPSVTANVVTELPKDTALTVISDTSVDDGTYIWIEVEDKATGNKGFVADALVAPA